MTRLDQLGVKVFGDGADLDGIAALRRNPLIKGFTTNPTLMRKANVRDYKSFALDALKLVSGLPVSFEVFADEFAEMERQAREIAGWGPNVYVKIPVMNTRQEFSGPLITRLARAGVQVNVTAVMTLDQVAAIAPCLDPATPSCVSVFAGRVADTGVDPLPIIGGAVDLLKRNAQAELIWASPRELLNIFQADSVGCHIITVTNDLLAKLPIVGKDLLEYSRETVEMFFQDAMKAGYTIG